MRITAFLLLAACLQVSARGHAQGITLSLKNAPLETVFREIQRQTGYSFVYNDRLMQQARNIDLQVEKASVENVLAQCFRDQPLDFSVIDRTIIVRLREGPPPAPPAPIDLHGHVTDSLGNPIAGASVTVKGSNKVTITDANGDFNFPGISPDAVLVISNVGYETRETRLNGRSSIALQLRVSATSLRDIEITNKGYYTEQQRLSTGDVSRVKREEIERQPVSNPLAAMEGRVPGMFITQSTGMPGGAFTVQIRGKNSIANGNDPLYVVDGVPYTSNLIDNLNPAGQGNPFNFINPSDIESIDVLKDADATAIYGSRGANGVVLITTKKGKTGRTQVNINAYTGTGKVARFMPLMNTQQYLQMRHEAFKNDNVTPTIANAPDLLLWDTTRYTDWQKKLNGGTANYADAQASVSGGNANTQYLFGGGYHRETSVFPGDFADQKASVHFSITSASANQKFKALLSGNYVVDNTNMPGSDLTSAPSYLPPDAPPAYNPDGTLNWAFNPSGTSTWTNGNPFASLLINYKGLTNNLVSNVVLSYQLVPGLEIKTSLGYTNMQITENTVTPITFYNPAVHITSGSTTFVDNNIHSWIVEPQASYHINISKGTLSALIGSTFQQSTSTGQQLGATGFGSDALLRNLQAATSITAQYVLNTQYKYNALFGRINYNWEDKYLINLTARRDGSSRFGPANQFQNFAAAGAAWVFSKEKFIGNSLPFLNFGKLRVSYGTTGNDQVGDYTFLDLYSTTLLAYQGIVGLTPRSLYNPSLAWEQNKKMEAGLELGFLKDRIALTSSYFRNRSSNQLLGYPLPGLAGFTSVAANLPAVVQNTGFEFLLNTVNIRSKDFTWSSSFNLTINRNKLIAYPNLATSVYGNSFVIGQPISILKRYRSIGVNDTTGVYQFTDAKGNPTYSPSVLMDRAALITMTPKFYGGLNNSFQYKGFQLDIFLQFVKQMGPNYLYSYTRVPPGYRGYNQPAALANSWTQPGDHSNFQKFTQKTGNIYTAYSSYVGSSNLAITDASYLRLKNVSLSYQLPGMWRQKMHIQNCRVYIQGQNLLTFTNHYTGADPEVAIGSLPPLRVITAGIQFVL